MNALQLFKQLPETKSEVENYTRIIRGEVLEGNVNPLNFITTVTALEKLFSNLKSDLLIKDCVMQEAEKHGFKSFDFGNAKFQIKEAGVSYDFKGCMDSEWDNLDSQIKELTEKKKQRESFLKTITGDMEIYGPDGVQIMPALKRSTTIVSVTLK